MAQIQLSSQLIEFLYPRHVGRDSRQTCEIIESAGNV